MKKFMVLGAAMCVAMAFTGCKSSESAYKKAYEKAKSQEQNTTTNTDDNATQQDAVVAPVETQPVTQAPVVDNYDNEPCTPRDCFCCKWFWFEGLQRSCWFIRR